MTRSSFLLFHALLITCLYVLIVLSHAKQAATSYMLWNFILPYLILNLVMLVISTIRWFMSHDPEIAKEIVTWGNALWLVPLLTLLALYLIRPADSHFWLDLRALMAIPKT